MMDGKKKTPRVWLHIGMPKTGTTTIQTVMSSNRKLLRQHGYFYPDFGDRQHVALARALARRAGSRVQFPDNGDCGPYQRFSELLETQAPRAHTSVISSENFFQRPACAPGYCGAHGASAFDLLEATVAETAKYFAGCEVTVLMWLRRQDNWLMSMYNETVKTSLYSRGFRYFADNSVGAHLRRVVELWIAAFGRERVICRSYDALARDKGNVVEDFLQTVCPNIPRDAFRKTDDPRNISLSNEGLWLKKRINGLVKSSGVEMDDETQARVRTLVAEVTRTSPDARAHFLSSADRVALMDRFLEDNRVLVEGMGYSELRPLIEVDDLEVPSKPAGELKFCLHSIDQLIKTLVLPASAAGEDIKEAAEVPFGATPDGVSQ
jgi:hypothetical protein